MNRAQVLLVLLLVLAACTPQTRNSGGEASVPRITRDYFHTGNGAVLPLTHWPAPEPKATVIALHGFNDYRGAFAWSAPLLAEAGLDVFAYDQRGFGETETAGWWSHQDAMVSDALTLARLLRAAHPERPVYLLGESMGAAVALAAAATPGAEKLIDGMVLSAPAAWGWSEMNVFYRASLWLASHLAPGWRPTGRRLGRVASDNRDALVQMGRDPNVIKATRVDSVYGLVGLMDLALERAPEVRLPVLVLHGEKDEIVPLHTVEALLERLPAERTCVIRYEEGWHLLLRDLQRERVIADIVAFLRRHVSRAEISGKPQSLRHARAR